MSLSVFELDQRMFWIRVIGRSLVVYFTGVSEILFDFCQIFTLQDSEGFTYFGKDKGLTPRLLAL